MPAVNVKFSEEELDTVRTQAAAAGQSLGAYIAAAAVRDHQRRHFVSTALKAYDRLRPEFLDLDPEDLGAPQQGQAAA
ncbi:hypothetical protein [Streptomyces sp. NBC_01465]|uniref:hypothetical protein n=1 Tax=Streptomyces sp. NBC_01465 TaxID=2903878 RepID=UPI002E3398D3|nr:hypothetical protein [Streptomyces sp. NBC_01465]